MLQELLYLRKKLNQELGWGLGDAITQFHHNWLAVGLYHNAGITAVGSPVREMGANQ